MKKDLGLCLNSSTSDFLPSFYEDEMRNFFKENEDKISYVISYRENFNNPVNDWRDRGLSGPILMTNGNFLIEPSSTKRELFFFDTEKDRYISDSKISIPEGAFFQSFLKVYKNFAYGNKIYFNLNEGEKIFHEKDFLRIFFYREKIFYTKRLVDKTELYTSNLNFTDEAFLCDFTKDIIPIAIHKDKIFFISYTNKKLFIYDIENKSFYKILDNFYFKYCAYSPFGLIFVKRENNDLKLLNIETKEEFIIYNKRGEVSNFIIGLDSKLYYEVNFDYTTSIYCFDFKNKRDTNVVYDIPDTNFLAYPRMSLDGSIYYFSCSDSSNREKIIKLTPRGEFNLPPNSYFIFSEANRMI